MYDIFADVAAELDLSKEPIYESRDAFLKNLDSYIKEIQKGELDG